MLYYLIGRVANKMTQTLSAQFFQLAFEFPTTQTPLWHERVDRWYQLDALSFGLTQAVWTWSQDQQFQLSTALVLACPGASNESDYAFASMGATSAQKFAHTLPNIRLSPVAQLMNWNGLSLCVQNDPNTLSVGLREAAGLAGVYGGSTLLSVFSGLALGISAPYLAFGLNLNNAPRNKLPIFSVELDTARDLNRPDAEVLPWLLGMVGGDFVTK